MKVVARGRRERLARGGLERVQPAVEPALREPVLEDHGQQRDAEQRADALDDLERARRARDRLRRQRGVARRHRRHQRRAHPDAAQGEAEREQPAGRVERERHRPEHDEHDAGEHDRPARPSGP